MVSVVVVPVAPVSAVLLVAFVLAVAPVLVVAVVMPVDAARLISRGRGERAAVLRVLMVGVLVLVVRSVRRHGTSIYCRGVFGDWEGGHRRLAATAAVFVVPALMAGIEAVVSVLSPHGSAGSLAYSQMDLLPVIQVASLGGVPAIVFLLGLFASTVTWIVRRRRIVARSLLAPVAVLAVALGFGGITLATSSTDPGPTVALVATNRFPGVPEDWREVWSAYEPQIVAAAGEGARIAVLPEKIFQIGAPDLDGWMAEVREVAGREQVDVVVGVDLREGDRALNRSYHVTAAGVVSSFDKVHMIPGGEAHFTPGAETVVIPSQGVEAGLATCKDMDFPATIRSYGAQGASTMLVPAWDFDDDDWFHSRLAVLRGVENGVARSARHGFVTLSDSQGRIVDERLVDDGRLAEDGFVTVVADLPSRERTPTLYSAIGDAFGWVSLAVAVGALAIGLRGRAKSGG